MHRTGGCACGAIRFTITAPPLGTGACHCRQCQKMSGGGANYVALVPKEALRIDSGIPRYHRSSGDSGAEVARAFCADCGTPLWSEPAHEPFLPVKIGAFDEAGDLAPRLHIYTASAPDWHLMGEGLPRFDKMPPRP